MEIDRTKSVAQLTGIEWREPSEGTSILVQERHEFRKTALADLSMKGLKKLIDIDFENDFLYLIPHSIQRIDQDIANAYEHGDNDDFETVYECSDLLLAILTNEKFEWLKQNDLVCKVRELVDRISYALYMVSDFAEQTDDSLEYYKVLLPNTQMKAKLYKLLALFERKISKVEQPHAANLRESETHSLGS